MSIKISKILRYLVVSSLLFVHVGTTGQNGITNLWLYGYDFGGVDGYIDFKSGSPVVTTLQIPMYFNFNEAIISNSNGDLLFYTNGNYIADATHDTMQNGSGLTPGWFADSYGAAGYPMGQASLIIPFPGDTTKYYLFHVTGNDIDTPSAVQPLDLFYSVIDMSLNNGLGAVTSKNISILSDTLILGELTAVKHANGRDWWIICHKHLSDMFYKILVTKYGIINILSQQSGGINSYGGEGQNVFSPNGNKYARYKPKDGLDILDFDRCTGLFTNAAHIVLNDSALAGGVVFSPSSRFLYVGSKLYLYQFDMLANPIESSKQVVAIWDTFYSPQPPFAVTFFKGMLAPDNKIYLIAPNGSDYLHVINSPDSSGTLCDVQQHSFYLQTFNAYSMPNYPNYFLGAESGSNCDSLVPVVEAPTKKNLLSVVNRSNDELVFTFIAGSKNRTLAIMDISGKVIFTQSVPQWSTNQKVSISNCSTGIYFARLESEIIKLFIH